jgi:hypothetical protein
MQYKNSSCSNVCEVISLSVSIMFSIQLYRMLMVYLIYLEQSTDQSTALELMIIPQVVFLRWNQRTAQASCTDLRFS